MNNITSHIIDNEFIKQSPCLYRGKILCEQCCFSKRCDMKAGREVKRTFFKKGWLAHINLTQGK